MHLHLQQEHFLEQPFFLHIDFLMILLLDSLPCKPLLTAPISVRRDSYFHFKFTYLLSMVWVVWYVPNSALQCTH